MVGLSEAPIWAILGVSAFVPITNDCLHMCLGYDTLLDNRVDPEDNVGRKEQAT